MSLTPGFAVRVNYTSGNGRITSLDVQNDTGGDAYADAVLTDGTRLGRTFPPGVASVPFPTGVRVVVDAAGEQTFTGLQSIGTRVPA